MKQIVFTFLGMFFWANAISQTLSIKITQPSQNSIQLLDHFGERTRLIDSATINIQGEYEFKIGKNWKPGLYTLKLGKDLKAQFYGGEEAELDIIVNCKENIRIKTALNAPVDSLEVLESSENQVYYQYIKRDKFISNQLGVLNELPNYFPEKDPFFPPVQKRYVALQKEYRAEIDGMLLKNSSLLAAHYIKTLRYPFMPFNLPVQDRMTYMKAHWFDEVNFADTTLIQTNLLTKKAWGYIQLYRDQSLNKVQQEPLFAAAADTVISKCLINETMAMFMRNQLVKLFEMLGMEKAVNHLAERYATIGSCTDHEGDALKKRLEGSQKLAIGKIAPEIIGTSVEGKFFDASTLLSEKTLLVFWASWCPHCKQEMAELKKTYEAQKPGTFSVVAVSIDTNANELKSYLKEKQLPWITLYDGKSWFGALPVAYHLYATPAFYVLDRNRKIVGKGGSLEDVLEYLR